MHFSKTYGQLLLTLPQELRDHAIEYRLLKKLINQVVFELTSLGLSPAVLHSLLQANEDGTNDINNRAVGSRSTGSSNAKGKERAVGERPYEDSIEDLEEAKRRRRSSPSKAVYELFNTGEQIEPRLRLWVGTADLLDQSDTGVANSKENSPTEDARVAIFFDRKTNTSNFVDNRSDAGSSDHSHSSTEELLALSKPITSKRPGLSLLWTLQRKGNSPERSNFNIEAVDEWNSIEKGNVEEISTELLHKVALVNHRHRTETDGTREVIVPLIYDAAFFHILQNALTELAAHLVSVRKDFLKSLEELARSISHTARPQSSISRFHTYSSLSDPSEVQGPSLSPFSTSFIPGGSGSSDLYTWREIFQLYLETEIFETVSERFRGERTIEDSEARLALFAERVSERGLSDARKLKLKESRASLERFLEINVLILNLKKFQSANAEAARKILKKHTKRTALPLPNGSLALTTLSNSFTKGESGNFAHMLGLVPTTTHSFPHLLVQAIGETLIPIIPHIDDYECLICTSIAFKPIRLACGHLFCVRCLVKMQKSGKGKCPMCRRETVLKADRSNVDWALLNFMQDWFPKESKEKQKQNEREATKEQLAELGLPDRGCIIS